MPKPMDSTSIATSKINGARFLADSQKNHAAISTYWLGYEVDQQIQITPKVKTEGSQNGKILNSPIRSVVPLPVASSQLISDHEQLACKVRPSPPTALEILCDVCCSARRLENDTSKHTQSSVVNMTALPGSEKPDVNTYINAQFKAALDHTYAQKPLTYKKLIAQAITNQYQQKATVQQIYSWIKNHPNYPELSKRKWQNIVRHNLSFNSIFQKVKNTDGKTKTRYWTVILPPNSGPTEIR